MDVRPIRESGQIGYALAAKRTERGCTQEEAANAIGISRNAYGDIERGKTDLKVSTLCSILRFLEASPDEILLSPSASPDRNASVKEQLVSCLDDLTPYEQSRFLETVKLLHLGLLQARKSSQ